MPLFSPSPQNISVSKGFMTFQRTGLDTGPVHLGNATKVTYTADAPVLPHFTEMAGLKIQDNAVITQVGGTFEATLEERTPYNLGLYFLGSPLYDAPDAADVPIYSIQQPIQGELFFYATNIVGPRWYFHLTNVLLAPKGGFEFISDGWSNLPMMGFHLADSSGGFGNNSLQPPVSAIAPQNVILPFIAGPLHIGDIPTFAQVGETLTCYAGQWIAAVTYAFQWYKSPSTLIGGATGNTYIPQAGDAGSTIYCKVTATNANGSAVAQSLPTNTVHA
jgi:hypothetical protein